MKISTKVAKQIASDKAAFNRLRKRHCYVDMGWMFWHGFMQLNKGPRRAALSKLWQSLSRLEKRNCEGV